MFRARKQALRAAAEAAHAAASTENPLLYKHFQLRVKAANSSLKRKQLVAFAKAEWAKVEFIDVSDAVLHPELAEPLAMKARAIEDARAAKQKRLLDRVATSGSIIREKVLGPIPVRKHVVKNPGVIYREGLTLLEMPGVELSALQYGELRELFLYFDKDESSAR